MKKAIILLFLFLCKAHSQQIIVATTMAQPPHTGFVHILDVSNCEVSNMVTSLSFSDIALAPDGQLYGTVNTWFRINPTTGSTTALPPSLSSNAAPNNLVALDNNTLLFVGSGFPGYHLFAYHISDGTLTDYGNVGYSSSGDLAWYDNALYLTNNYITWEGPDENILVNHTLLIKIELNSDNTAVQSITQINDTTNPLPGGMHGLTTVAVANSNNILIGAALNKLYKICPYDASYELICETDYPIAGLASPRLAVQNPEPVSCNNLSLADIANNVSSLLPNPIAKDGVLHIELPLGNSYVNAKIVNMQEMVLYNESSQNNTIEIDLRNLNMASGLYFVEISHDSKTKTHKLLVN